uniref:Uncharacterized protein n=1 Tax=Lepeophtheirus salmonis TaxID=72036 RepID=A0A0K2SY32_LEPSM
MSSECTRPSNLL